MPDVAGMRGEVEGIFRRVLAPQSIAVGAPELNLPFEFSLGVPLAKTPVARAAILLLSWMEDALGQDELTWLMLSGFLWKDESDLLAAAEFDAKTRRSGVLPPEYTLHDYLRQDGWNRSEVMAGLRAAIACCEARVARSGHRKAQFCRVDGVGQRDSVPGRVARSASPVERGFSDSQEMGADAGRHSRPRLR